MSNKALSILLYVIVIAMIVGAGIAGLFIFSWFVTSTESAVFVTAASSCAFLFGYIKFFNWLGGGKRVKKVEHLPNQNYREW